VLIATKLGRAATRSRGSRPAAEAQATDQGWAEERTTWGGDRGRGGARSRDRRRPASYAPWSSARRRTFASTRPGSIPRVRKYSNEMKRMSSLENARYGMSRECKSGPLVLIGHGDGRLRVLRPSAVVCEIVEEDPGGSAMRPNMQHGHVRDDSSRSGPTSAVVPNAADGRGAIDGRPLTNTSKSVFSCDRVHTGIEEPRAEESSQHIDTASAGSYRHVWSGRPVASHDAARPLMNDEGRSQPESQSSGYRVDAGDGRSATRTGCSRRSSSCHASTVAGCFPGFGRKRIKVERRDRPRRGRGDHPRSHAVRSSGNRAGSVRY